MTGRTPHRGANLIKLRHAPLVFWLEAAGWSCLFGAIVGIPTVLIANEFFARMTPARWSDYAFWAAASSLSGLTMSLRRFARPDTCHAESRSVVGISLTYLAVGCPICNKVAVALLGTAGALAYFAPAQPLLGLLAIGLLVHAFSKGLPKIDFTTSYSRGCKTRRLKGLPSDIGEDLLAGGTRLRSAAGR
jgi:hypothetical protein